MKVLKSFEEVAEEFGVNSKEVEKQFYCNLYRKIFYINGVEIIIHSSKIEEERNQREMVFIVMDSTDNKDCKEYMMQYELQEYDFKVYTDEIISWESCKIIDIKNTRLGIDRATVVTKTGTQLNRVCKFVSDEEDQTIKEDGCIYFWKK